MNSCSCSCSCPMDDICYFCPTILRFTRRSLCVPFKMNEEALISPSVWTQAFDGGARSGRSLDLCRCPAASVSAGCRLRNGGREVEESGLIIPIWPSSSHQIPDSAGRQTFMVTSGHSHLTPSKASLTKIVQDESESWVYCKRLLGVWLTDWHFLYPTSVEMFPVNHSWIAFDRRACTQRQQLGKSRMGVLSVSM